MNDIGKRIKECRTQAGISQDELAKRLGYKSRSSISKIEKNSNLLTQRKIEPIAKALGVKPSYIMGWNDASETTEDNSISNASEEDIVIENNMRKWFALNIDALIKQSGKQQKEVAEAIGIAPTTFNTWCVGKILPSLPKLQKIADYFGIEIKDLIEPMEGAASMDKIKNNLKRLRQENGLTLLEVANYLGVREATVQRYESGRIKHIRYDYIEKLSKLYQCDPSVIIGWNNSEQAVANKTLSEDSIKLVQAYQNASDGIKEAVAKLLNLK